MKKNEPTDKFMAEALKEIDEAVKYYIKIAYKQGIIDTLEKDLKELKK